MTRAPLATYGVDSMAGELRHVAMRRPGAILDCDHERWHYTRPIDPPAMLRQFEAFAARLEADGATIHWIEPADDGLADSIFTFDPSFAIPGGVVILRPGKALRADEAALHARFYEGLVPVVGTVEAPAIIEGGDCCWLGPTTIAVGRGYRTDQAGIEQLAAIVAPYGISVEAYDMPYFRGPEACLHLLSVVNPLDVDLALVYAPLVPVALYERLRAAGYELLHVPDDEFEASGGLNLNVLPTRPRRCLAIAGFPRTKALMEDAGCDVATFEADELCLPCEGGPTCLTRPLHRL
ncbi:MAG: arginine deiminase family protein [Candidatus Limnocylindrales bacterium]